MKPKHFFEQIAQGEYEAFRKYLNTGENGGPVTSLNLSLKLREIPNRRVFLDHLFEAIKPITTLTTLKLGYNNIGDNGAAAIAQALKTNATLTKLNLWFNYIGNKGAIDIAQALKINSSLKTLKLKSNKINAEGAAAIAQALNTNTALTTLDLGMNNIGPEGVAAFLRQIPLDSTLTSLRFEDRYSSAQIKTNNIIRALQKEKNVLDEVYRQWPQPITEAFAQHFTLIKDEAAPNLLIDPNNDISRGLAYVRRRKLTEENENIIEQNKRREQAQSGESAQETPLNAAPTSNDSQNTSQTFALGKRNKEQDNSVKRPRTRYQNISKREAEEINKEAKVFCGEINDENEGKRRKLRARK